jgi:hypothetical protein
MNQKKMRKFSSFMAAAVAMLAAVSCNKEINNIDPVTPDTDAVVYTAYVDGAETKTYLGGTTGEGISKQTAALWAANDAITIHNGETAYTFTTKDNATSAAKFEYDMQNGEYDAGEGVMAVYPASNTTTADVVNKTVTAMIPTYQPSRDNNFSEGAVPSVAYTKDQSLAFKNAATLLKFTVKGTNVKGLVFYGNKNEAVSGNILVSLNKNNTIESIEAQKTTITENDVTETKYITWAKVWANTNDWCFDEEVDYYLAVVPQMFEKGFAVQLEVDGVGLVEVKKLETPYELKPNTIVDLGELEYVEPDLSNENWGIVGSFTNWADNNDVEMNVEGNWYIARDVEMPAGSEFKFRTDGKWGTELTYSEGSISAGREYPVAAGAGNIVVNAGAVYDVYLSPSSKKMKIVKVGDISPDAKGTWSLTGSFSSWDAASKAYPMIAEGKWFICRNFKLDAAAEVKLVENYSWDSNRGGTWAGKDKAIAVTFNGANIAVPEGGTYDVYMNADKTTVYFMTPGNVPSI